MGHSESPTTLVQFLQQFSQSLPPADVCIRFLSKPHPAYINARLPPNVGVVFPPSEIEDLYIDALKHGAKRIVCADDDTFFPTMKYGTGKSDVTDTAGTFEQLLPFPNDTRVAPAGIVNAAAIFSNHSVLSRAVPEQHLRRTGGEGEAYYPTLKHADAKRRAAVTGLLTHTPDTHAHLWAFQVFGDKRNIRQADEEVHVQLLGLMHHRGSLAALAKPAIYERDAAWLLPVPHDDVIAGMIAQRALWESDHDAVLVVSGGVDVWKSALRREKELESRSNLERVLQMVMTVRNSGGGKWGYVDELYADIAAVLASEGLIRRGVPARVRRFHKRLQQLKIGRMRVSNKNNLDKNDANSAPMGETITETAVCMSGQMRSAAFTHRNIVRTLNRGIGVGKYDMMIVTARDDRSAAARLFNAKRVGYSSEPPYLDAWVRLGLRSAVVHETMSTQRQLSNYIRQLWDMRTCLDLVREEEGRRGQKYKYVIRLRPDVVFYRALNAKLWIGRGAVVVYGARQAYYAMNDRFFAGDRESMGRLMSCHDAFEWIVGGARVYKRSAGDATHMLFKKDINSERFLARCAAWKKVATRGEMGIEVRRVAWSDGQARWREFIAG